MKRILQILAGLVVLGVTLAGAGEIRAIYFATNNLNTNIAYTAAQQSLVSDEAPDGYLEGLLIQLSVVSDLSPTVSVQVVEEADVLDYERVMFTVAGMTGTNNFYLIRPSVVTELGVTNALASNQGARNFFMGGKARLKLYSAGTTNISVKAWLYTVDEM